MGLTLMKTPKKRPGPAQDEQVGEEWNGGGEDAGGGRVAEGNGRRDSRQVSHLGDCPG
jgi:hypothetical protein